MIDAAHLKGLYKGTNLVAVAMDGNNQIVPIAFGICKGETGPCWSWWMSVLKECIGDHPNLLFISDRHAAIALAVEKEFPLAFHAVCCRHLMMNLGLKNKKRKGLFWSICKAYTREDYATNMNTLQIVQPDAHEKLCRAGPQRWSRAHCPLVRYNYMTSNSVESVNACSVIYRKEPVLKLAETYRAMVQEWYYKRRQLAGVNAYQYEVSDGQYIREVNLQTGICGCRKWQLSGLPCGHVIAITRFLGLTDCVNYVADWFKKPKYQATYSDSIHSLGNMQQWEFPENIQKAIPPRMDNPQPGRPKNTNRIKSQGEEPRIIRCTRCTQTGHRRDQCGQPFVVQPPVNTRTHNDQQFTQNNQPSFNNPSQQSDNTFNNINVDTSQQYADTTYPSQPYCQTPYPSQPYDQHFANTSQPYTGHYTESSQMYEQYNSQQYDAQHLDDINTNGSNIAGKLQIFVSHTQIDLSTVLIPNDGSLEESFAGFINKTKPHTPYTQTVFNFVVHNSGQLVLDETNNTMYVNGGTFNINIPRMKLADLKQYLLNIVAQYKLEIYIDHIGVNFVIHKYIFPNSSLAEMMNHVITDYSSENEGIIRQETQNDYTSDQMVEWAEQEHFEYEETKVSCPKIDLSSMLIHNNRSKEESFGEAIDEEAILEEQILALMHRFADRFTDRRVEINNLMVLHDHALVDYGKYALGCMTGADMKKCVYLKSVRDELLRSMEEKRQLMANYRDM
ncbi:transposase, MuDR, MULE transposase domain protein [Tanacetum coccineum]